MSKGVNVILMYDDGRTWRCRIQTAWIKIGVYTLLALFLTSGAGLFGSLFFWHKFTWASSENHVMRAQIAEMQPKLNRLLMFERILHDYDQPQAWETMSLPAPPMISDVGMDAGLAKSRPRPTLIPYIFDVFPSAIPTPDIYDTVTDQESEESLATQASVADSASNGYPAGLMAKPMSASGTSSPSSELAEGRAPHEPAGASHPEAEIFDEPADHLAEADNVELSLRDNKMELRFDLHNRSKSTIAGQIAVSFIARDDQVVQAEGDQRALRFRIQFFREVHSPLYLPTGYSISEMSAMRIDIVSRIGDILYSQTYPLENLLPGTG